MPREKVSRRKRSVGSEFGDLEEKLGESLLESSSSVLEKASVLAPVAVLLVVLAPLELPLEPLELFCSVVCLVPPEPLGLDLGFSHLDIDVALLNAKRQQQTHDSRAGIELLFFLGFTRTPPLFFCFVFLFFFVFFFFCLFVCLFDFFFLFLFLFFFVFFFVFFCRGGEE